MQRQSYFEDLCGLDQELVNIGDPAVLKKAAERGSPITDEGFIAFVRAAVYDGQK